MKVVKICLPGKAITCLGFALLAHATVVGAESTGAGSGESRESWILDILVLRPKAEQGSVESQVALGDLFLNRQQFAEAVHWYRRAATNHEVTAQLALAGCLIAGRGTAENRKEAAYWIRQAADGVEQGIGSTTPDDKSATARPQSALPRQSNTAQTQVKTNLTRAIPPAKEKNLFTNSDSHSTPEDRSSNVSPVEPRKQESGLVLQPFEIPK